MNVLKYITHNYDVELSVKTGIQIIDILNYELRFILIRMIFEVLVCFLNSTGQNIDPYYLASSFNEGNKVSSFTTHNF